MRLAHLCEAFGLDIQFHACGPAHRHCMAATRNTHMYEMALIELARFLPRPEYRNRFLRGGMRAREHGDLPPIGVQEHPPAAAAFERPPGLALEGIARPALTPRKDP